MSDEHENRVIIGTPKTFHRTIEQIKSYGLVTAPRGEPTYELINSTIVFRNPRDRIIHDPARKMNIAFAIAELASILFEIEDVSFFTKFIKDYGKYSTNGEIIDGCYGPRIHGTKGIAEIIAMLTLDPQSRRAVLPIYQYDDLNGDSKNTPCTLSLQFLVRNSQLDMIVNMRSSDIVRGVTYDLFVFSMLQELIARRLKLNLGTYYHNAGSLHLYESDLDMVKTMGYAKRWPHLMNPMPEWDMDDLRCFHHLVVTEDNGNWFNVAMGTTTSTTPEWSSIQARLYFTSLAATMKAFTDRKDNPGVASKVYQFIDDSSLRHVLRPWMKSVGLLGTTEEETEEDGVAV